MTRAPAGGGQLRVGLVQRLMAAGRAVGRLRARLDDSGRVGLVYTSTGLGRLGAGRPVSVRVAVEVKLFVAAVTLLLLLLLRFYRCHCWLRCWWGGGCCCCCFRPRRHCCCCCWRRCFCGPGAGGVLFVLVVMG